MQAIIRKATIEDAQSIAEVRTSSWQTTYRGIVSDSYLNSMDTAKNAQLWKQIITQNPFVLVAETDRIVGFASGGKNRTAGISVEGEIYTLYLLKEYQGKGIGKILFDTIVDQFIRSKITSMMVLVLKDNPSKNFYIKQGGKLIAGESIEIGGQKLIEEAYVWKDLPIHTHH